MHEEMTDCRTGVGQVKGPESYYITKERGSKKQKKNHGRILQRHRNEHEGASAGQILDNLSIKIIKCSKNDKPLKIIRIHEFMPITKK